MNNVSKMKGCYGCGVCNMACPKNIISIKLNADGFYEPEVDNSLCIECGLCLSVCAYNDDNISLPEKRVEIKSYASWSKNDKVRYDCSSGGIGFEIGKYLLENGYKACGVRYNAHSKRAEHFIAYEPKEYLASIGSKYIQSYTVDAFSQVNKKEKYLITGTPCQIDSFRRYIKKFKVEDNFVLMDFFCHGVPSMLMWEKYLKSIENQTGNIHSVSWRDKQFGWHDSWAMNISGEKSNHFSLFTKGNLFYKFFLSDTCLGKACYDKCKYKLAKSSADIRIGDLWGNTYRHNEEGVSGLIVFSERGKEIIENMQICKLQEITTEIVTEGQMKHSPSKMFSPYIIKKLKSKKTIESISKHLMLVTLLRRINRKIKTIITR
ncbi:4Fe-4S dicluster domain-containing protein [Paludibacter sp. 221]|uniref:Coenzyme F420 hydrogenase/dehydrogenase, beta subunit C-terminal domain n=1 Tax=Paludibacter sp. 221 TaxID=2302939 RepID=UPI0013D12595|nr:Coenzyme F420 hydrogenase/dehydrogenase, beta subunit C-terminal domain [Paludibacter sp. 221]NDV47271.1 4Fe-4S dicluster domain-containing protein [Paludibacter sp. 221]